MDTLSPHHMYPYGYFLSIWIFLILVSGVFFIVTMILIKNPICGHGLIVNTEQQLELYPNKKSPLIFAWGIFK